jgi:flavodoxin
MKNVIVYYSFTHNNEKLARLLSEKLQCEKLRIETVKPRNGFSIFLDIFFKRTPTVKDLEKSLAVYDHVIFISPIWAGKIATPMKSLLQREHRMVARYSFISLCGGAPGQEEKIERELVSLLGKKPDAHVELSVRDAIALHENGRIRTIATQYRVAADGLEIYEPQLRQFILDNSVVEVE